MFVLPSREEGMSIALLEAMALGIPVVASSIPGNRSLIDDWNMGDWFPPGTPSLRERSSSSGKTLIARVKWVLPLAVASSASSRSRPLRKNTWHCFMSCRVSFDSRFHTDFRT